MQFSAPNLGIYSYRTRSHLLQNWVMSTEWEICHAKIVRMGVKLVYEWV